MDCILCHEEIVNSNNRFLVSGKGNFDIRQELQSLPSSFKVSEGRFACRKCLAKLWKRRGLLTQIEITETKLQTLTLNLKATANIYTSTPKKSKLTLFYCILCHKEIGKSNDRFLIEGKSKFNVRLELQTLSLLPSSLNTFDSHVCRECVSTLKKRRRLLQQVENTNSSFDRLKRSNVGIIAATNDLDVSTPKKSRTEFTPQTSPIHNQLPVDSPIHDINDLPDNCETQVEVSVTVKWRSKVVTRSLPSDLQSLGKMLVRGTYKQVAAAAWNNTVLKSHFTELVSKDIEKEATKLCSRKEPSCLRSTDKKSVLEFTMGKLEQEIQERMPLFHSCLSAVCTNSKSRASSPTSAAIGMAAAVCLRNRSKYMIVVQLLITTFLYHSNWMVSFNIT